MILTERERLIVAGKQITPLTRDEIVLAALVSGDSLPEGFSAGTDAELAIASINDRDITYPQGNSDDIVINPVDPGVGGIS